MIDSSMPHARIFSDNKRTAKPEMSQAKLNHAVQSFLPHSPVYFSKLNVLET
jgi:hypothetical protein